MFFRQKQMAYHAKPEKPDPLFAKMLQEPLGGQWGEISVMMTYLFQGWSCRGPQKYRDMILDIATEEIGHVEMLATMIAGCWRARRWRRRKRWRRIPLSAP